MLKELLNDMSLGAFKVSADGAFRGGETYLVESTRTHSVLDERLRPRISVPVPSETRERSQMSLNDFILDVIKTRLKYLNYKSHLTVGARARANS